MQLNPVQFSVSSDRTTRTPATCFCVSGRCLIPCITSDPSTEEPSARRHRSDLTPTAPPGHSFRDPPPARHRSPGKAVSLSRLDQLAQPRRPLLLLHVTSPPPAPAPTSGRQWQSMWHLGPVAAPRPTRATLLRRAARQRPPETGR